MICEHCEWDIRLNNNVYLRLCVPPILQDFQGFLNDLQDWELSLEDKDKKMKGQAYDKGISVIRRNPLEFYWFFWYPIIGFLLNCGNLVHFHSIVFISILRKSCAFLLYIVYCHFV